LARAEFTAQERQAILRHELAHFQRGDVWTSLAARSIALPHWFNPCAWWAVRKFEEGGEWACDAKLLSDPHQIPSFARAMLAMSEPVPNRVCTSAARGSSLSVRLKRLLSFQSPEDSVMKRALLCGVLVCLVAGGMFRVHLVARAQEEERAPVSRQRTEQQIAAFTKRVAGGDRLKEFKAALATPAGKVVLRDRISFYEEQLRNESRDDALPSYFEKRFELTDGEYRLRAGQERYREELLSTVSAFNEDVEKIAAALRGVSQEIDGKTEADRLLVRFMNHEAAPAMLYIQELRERLRPDVGLVEKLLGQIFVANEDGKYIVRPGRRSEAAEYLKQVQVIRKSVKPIRAELAEWSKELVAKDDFHRRVKKALGEPLFASFIAAELIGEGGGDISRKIQQFFDELGDIAVDTADGLEIVEAGEREEIERALKKYQQTVRISRKLSKALKSFAAKIDDQSELEKGWRDALSTELAIVRIGGEYEYADADADAIIRELLGEVLEDKGDNKKAVAAGRAEEVTRFVREMFRQFRSVRSRARSIDETAENLSDTDLSAALKTMGGKFAVLHSIQQELKAKQVDGFSVWLREHFVDTDNGWALRDGADQMIKEFLAEVSEVNAELKKDDF
jgi:hypothetical protein